MKSTGCSKDLRKVQSDFLLGNAVVVVVVVVVAGDDDDDNEEGDKGSVVELQTCDESKHLSAEKREERENI